MDPANLKYLKSPAALRLFIEVFISLFVIKMLLLRLKLTRILEILDPGGPFPLRTFCPGEFALAVKFIHFFIYKVFRSRNPCMLRSLLLFRRLRRAGLDVRIAFGVGDLDTDLKGHAWLVFRGRHILENEDPEGRYEAVFVYPR
jgi:hypothetical protein